MAGVPDQTAFFREGLLRYADARETVNYFQTCVQEAISKAFEAKSSWRNFQPSRGAEGLESGKGMGSVFIHGYIVGTVPTRNLSTRIWLSLGLYWNPPLLRGPATVVASSHSWIGGEGIWVPFNRPKSSGVVTLGPLYKRNERRLMLTSNEDFDPDVSFGLLLDAADEALGPLEDMAALPGV